MAASAVLAMAMLVLGAVSPASAAPPSGTVLAWGSNLNGELGNGSNATSSHTPVSVSLPSGTTVTAVAGGGIDSLALTSTGQVLAWGYNGNGELGNATNPIPSHTPVSVSLPSGTTVTAIAAGGRGFGSGASHNLALTSTGQVLAWGFNSTGQLGNGTDHNISNKPVPVSLPSGTTVTAIAAGGLHSLALTSTGEVLAWGDNTSGQLGNGSNAISSNKPVSVSLSPGTTVTAIAAGGGHNLALTSTGQVLAWGNNGAGQLGNGSNVIDSRIPVSVSLPSGTTVTAVGTGGNHNLALTSTGQVLAWGDNRTGQLGNGTDGTTIDHSNMPVPVLLPSGTTVTAVAAGNFHSLALASTGQVLAWGGNVLGQLGNGSNALNSNKPVSVSLPSGTTVTAVATGSYHSLAITGQATPTRPSTPTPTLPITGSPAGAVWLAIALTTTGTGGVLLLVANRRARCRPDTHQPWTT